MNRGSMWVDTVTGSFNSHIVDVKIQSAGSYLVIERYYDSINENSNNAPWDKWVFLHDEHLRFDLDQAIRAVYPQGGEDRFVKTPEGTYAPSNPKNHRTLTADEGGTFTVGFPEGGAHTFRSGDGRLVAVRDACGNTFTYEWAPASTPPFPRPWDLRSITDPTGHTMEILHTEVTGESHRLDFIWQGSRLVSYVFGHVYPDLNTVIDREGRETHYEYGSQNPSLFTFPGLKKITFPDGGWVQTYSAGERPNAVLAGRQLFGSGREILYDYDRKSLKTTVTDGGRVTVYQYDSQGNVISICDAEGYVTSFRYDENNRLVGKIDPRLGAWSYAYDSHGNMVSITDPLGNTTTSEYHPVFTNHVVKVLGPAGPDQRITEYTLDPATGNTLSVRNAMGEVTTMEYDQYGHVVKRTKPRGNSESFGYNESGNLVWQEDGLGDRVLYTYDSQGRMLTMTNPLGRTTRYTYEGDTRYTVTDPLGYSTISEYDTMGHLVRSTDALGNQTLYEYDETGSLFRVTNALGETETYEYNDFLEKTKSTDRRGYSTLYAYDKIGRATSVTAPDGSVTSYDYLQSCGQTITTDPRGNQRQELKDLLCRVTRIILEDGSYTSYEYNAYGDQVRAIDALGRVTTATFDKLGRPLTVTDPLGYVVRSAYDANGNLISSTDRMGAVTHHTYDAADRQTASQYPDGSRVESTFDAGGNLIATKDQLGKTSTSIYDAAGRLVRTSTPLGEDTVYTLDALGRTTATTSPSGRTTTFEYDALSRRIAVTDPLGNTTRSSFDPNGNLVTQVDALGNALHYNFNSMNRMTTLVDPLKGTTKHSYDPVGNLVAVEDQNGHVTSYVFDARNRLTAEIFADGSRTELTYDANSNVTQVRTPRSENILSTYDALGRTTRITYPDTGETTFDYDSNGNRTKMRDATGETLFTYDVMGRLMTKTNPDGKEIRYARDLAGRLTSMVYPDGSVVRYEYDDDGRLTALVDGQGDRTAYGYNLDGQPVRTDFPNGAWAVTTYDAAGRPATLHQYDSSGATLLAQELDYDSTGNIIRLHDGATTLWSYEYDAASRLIAATDSLAQTTRYAYDPAGNMLTRTLPDASVIRYEYNDLNQLTAAGDTSFLYDAAGNLFKKISSQGVTRYNFNSDGRLTAVSLPDGTGVQFLYNADRELVGKTDRSGATHRYLWSGSNKIAEYDDSGLLIRFSYGLGLVSAKFAEGKRFFHHDYLGSVACLTDPSGTATDTYAYDPWGEPLSSTGTTSNEFRFVGAMGVEWDGDVELYYMRARWYDAEISRFLSRDPFGQSTDYIYSGDEPIRFTDPSGLQRNPSPISANWPTWPWQDVPRLEIKEMSDYTDWVGPFPFKNWPFKCHCPQSKTFQRATAKKARVTECTFLKNEVDKIFIPYGKNDDNPNSPAVPYANHAFYTVGCNCRYSCKNETSDCGIWKTEGLPRVYDCPSGIWDHYYISTFRASGEAKPET